MKPEKQETLICQHSVSEETGNSKVQTLSPIAGYVPDMCLFQSLIALTIQWLIVAFLYNLFLCKLDRLINRENQDMVVQESSYPFFDVILTDIAFLQSVQVVSLAVSKSVCMVKRFLYQRIPWKINTASD